MIEVGPKLATVLQAYSDGLSRSLHVSMPAEVVALDPYRWTATVQPLYVDNDGERLERIMRVPLWHPGGGGFVLETPPDVGDRVLLVFTDYSNDSIAETGSAGPRQRSHAYVDAVALVGWRSYSEIGQDSLGDPGRDNLSLGRKDGTMVLRITKAGRLTLGNLLTGVDLLDLFDQLLAQLQVANAGGFPLDGATQTELTQLRTNLATLRP